MLNSDLEDKPHLRISEAAARANMHVDTLRSLIRAGKGPKVLRYSSRLIRILEDDFKEWLRSVRA